MNIDTVKKLLANQERNEVYSIISKLSNYSEDAEEWLLDYCSKKGKKSDSSLIVEKQIQHYWFVAEDIIDDANMYGGTYNEDDAYDEETRVAIADMRQFVTYDTSQLVVVEAIANAGSHGDGVALLVDATGKGVELRVVDDVNLGHRHTAGHRQVLHDVIHTRILPALQWPGSSSITHYAGVCEVGNHEPDAHDTHDPGQCHEECLVSGHRVKFQMRALIAIAVRHILHVHKGEEGIHHSKYDARKKDEQQQALRIVPNLLGMNANVTH